MNWINNLALISLAALASMGTAEGANINFYEQGSAFLTAGSGGTLSHTVPATGNNIPGLLNTLSVTSGSQTVSIEYETADGAGNPQNLVSGSNASYGFFLVTSTGGTGLVSIPSFTFDLHITDLTDSGTLDFIGSSSGGQIGFTGGAGIDTVNLNFTPLSATLGTSTFRVFSPTSLVAPVSAANFGTTTIQGQVFSSNTPEPASIFLAGAGLLSVALLSRRKLNRK